MVQLLYIVASLHTLLCPFTKVEESFNIHATHDILYHRHNLSQYDHNEFPGVVPRSFIGPLALSIVSAPTVSIFSVMEMNKFWSQYVVRLVLALMVIAAWIQLKNTLKRLYGNTYAWWYTLITVTQYHFMFYMSRPLPNIMVLPLVILAFDGWLSNKQKQFIISAGASIIIFRAELAMLFGLFLIIDLYFKKIDVLSLIKTMVPAGIGLLVLTVGVDSFFWRRLIWPEAEVFWYNTVMNKSSNWGTSPFLWYFYSALPRGLGPSLVLIPVGLYVDKRMVQVTAPAIVYILLYSFLPHKELRFIIYVFPLLNMASAAFCSFIYVRRTKTPIYELLFWGQIVVIVGNVAMTVTLVCVAMTNYPGGVAMARFHKLLAHEPFVHVHIGNFAAQTGVTRFTQLNDHWMYSKNESLEPEQLMEYTHLLVEAKSKYSPNIKTFAPTHDVIDTIESFSHIALSYKLFPPIKIKTRPAIFILQRKDYRENPFGVDLENDVIEFSTEYDGRAEESLTNQSDEIDDIEYMDENQPDLEPELEYEEFIDEPLKIHEEVEEKYDEIVDETKPQEVVDTIHDIVEVDDKVDVKPASKLSKTKKSKDIYSQEVVDETIVETPKVKAKKVLDDLKTLRQERKKRAIEKIKSETRKEVVASAKEKLKEIMKRHKHIAEELSENISISKNHTAVVEERGDIPESETLTPEQLEDITETKDEEQLDSLIQFNDTVNTSNENVDSIVEEVIQRLIDRKIYDDKTKPEDIKAEDRQMIQKIVEEVLSERMNYTKTDHKL